jgi:YHS domain-containing protein
MSEKNQCPICGKDVDPLRARAMGIFGGKQFYFCSQDCKAKFADPRKAPREESQPVANARAEAPAAAQSEPPKAKDSPVKKAKAEARAAAAEEEAEDEKPGKPIKKDPTPSVMEDLGAVQGGAGRVWGLVIVLFAAAGVVLFFALK